MPGSQIVNRLQDLGYRVQACSDAAGLLACAQGEGPMLIVADLQESKEDLDGLIVKLKKDGLTQHVPIIAFTADNDATRQESARQAGATLAVNETAMASHLSELLEQALRID